MANQKPYNMEPNNEAALSYLIPPLTGLLVFFSEKENRYVRFHAFQSILFGILAIVASKVAVGFFFIFLGRTLLLVVNTVIVIVWLILMWRAYNGEEFELPFLGKIAKDQANK